MEIINGLRFEARVDPSGMTALVRWFARRRLEVVYAVDTQYEKWCIPHEKPPYTKLMKGAIRLKFEPTHIISANLSLHPATRESAAVFVVLARKKQKITRPARKSPKPTK